ncbi:MAG: sulfatase-like hydrolase/transferase [Bacteroidota bacterium]
MKKRLLQVSAVLALLVLVGGIWFWFNWHRLPGILGAIQNPVGPNQPVEWATGPADRTSDQPNIIVILVDDMGFNEVSTYGGGMAGGRMKTPHIDQLAADGVLCTNGYSTTAVCAASRASLLTGRNSTRFGYEFTPTAKGFGRFIAYQSRDATHPYLYDAEVDASVPHRTEMGLPPSEIILPEILKPQGYHNVHIGKWHLGGLPKFSPVNQGFDESLWMESGGMFLPEDHPDVVNARLPWDPIDRFLWANLPYSVRFNDSKNFEPDGHLTDYFTNEAVKVIDKNKNRPFFLYLAYWAIHTPLQALKSDYEELSYIDNHVERVQASMVRSVDRGVGKIRAALKENGLLDNTIIIFTCDNGGPGYVGLPDINQPFRGWKLSLFEGGIHIPYMVSYPDSIPAGQVYDGRVSNVDIFSTLGTLTGANLPTDRKMDGANILPYLTGAKSGEPTRPLFTKNGTYSQVIQADWKLQWDQVQKKKWLFDLKNDPTEQNNLIDQAPDKAKELTTLLSNFLAEQAAPIWEGALHGPIYPDKHLNEAHLKDDEFIYWQN